MAFNFDASAHLYTLDGKRLWSVTDVLTDNGLINKSNFNKTARSRGAAVHAGIALDLRGKLDESSLHPDLRGYLESARKFIRRPGLTVLDLEIPNYHPLYMFAGTRDLRYNFEGFEWIGDWKTGAKVFWGGYQTGAYDLLAPPVKKLRRRACIYLEEDGSMPKVDPHPDASDGNYFLAFLTATKRREFHKIKSNLGE